MSLHHRTASRDATAGESDRLSKTNGAAAAASYIREDLTTRSEFLSLAAVGVPPSLQRIVGVFPMISCGWLGILIFGVILGALHQGVRAIDGISGGNCFDQITARVASNLYQI